MEYFKCPKIQYEGADSKNPFAFKHYDANSLIGGKKMKEHLRFAAPYWHVMRNALADPFGEGTALMPWDDGTNSTENALNRVDVFFEFFWPARRPFIHRCSTFSFEKFSCQLFNYC